ncbi:MAG TPA: Calx-beta domain-containing protein [Pyrinomonadaceae bacterium]|nr:Calx-beta domain-containing protein [Pyrinomonadaceae bacterium]
MLNDGSGKFDFGDNILLEGIPTRSVLSDVNNDGKLDIIAGLFNGTDQGRVVVILGDGSGSFPLVAPSPFSTFSTNSDAVVVGDFNEDGKRDLAVPGRLAGVDIWLGNGTGVFSLGPNVFTSNNPVSLAVADFNADGHLDLLAGNRVVLGTGTGSFSVPIVVPIPEADFSAVTADVNNDSHLDVVSSGQFGLTIMLGNGTGNLTRGKSYVSGEFVFVFAGPSTVLGDFNEDGKLDIAAAQPQGVGILDGDGTGAFNDALSYHTSAAFMRGLVGADFNNDGKQDFALVGPSFGGLQNPGGSNVEVALGDGSGVFTRKSLTNFGALQLTGVTTADFNSDGKLDLAVIKASDVNISILLNDGTGGFPADGFSVPTISLGIPLSVIRAADFNNDTKADLIVLSPGFNTYTVLLGTGTGTFTNIGGGPLQSAFHFTEDMDIGDFNGDSKLDLAIVRSGTSVVHVLQGDGTGHFSDYAVVQLTGPPVSIHVRDLNGDGKDDLAVSHAVIDNFAALTFVTVFLNNGAQGFNAGTSYPTDGAGILGSGDFNSDNKPDLVASGGAIFFGGNLSGIAVFTNKGNGEFNASVTTTTGQFSDQVLVGDFNNDAKDDVAVTHAFGGVGILLNNFTSAQPCLSINDVSVTETDTGTVNAVFTVKLSEASTQTVRVNYFTTSPFFPGTGFGATKGVDFEDVPDTLTFLPGETTKTLNVAVKGDLIDELDQFFDVILTTPINAAISDGKGVGTIVDNDSPPSITINDTTVIEGTGFHVQNFAVFTLTLSAPSEKEVFVNFSLAPGTASANVDYFNTTSNAGIAPHALTATIMIPIIAENMFELDETFFINLSNPTGATITDSQGQATIINDDPQPVISMSGSSFRTEGEAGTSVNAQFDVTLSNPSSQTITVAFATANVSATAGSDYVATSGTLTFNPGETSKPIPVQIIGDNIDEADETYIVSLSNPTFATISAGQGVGTIADDDGPTLSIGPASVTEGNSGFVNAVFTVTLSAASSQDVVVNYATIGGTATSNIDFQRVISSTLFIPAGATSATLNVRVFGDFEIEPNEQFTVSLQNATNATIAVAQGTGTIVNDDSAGKLQFSVQAFSASEDAGSAVITVNRVDGATGVVTVNFATSNGTATAGSDYNATTGTLIFPQGETSKTFSVPIVLDNVLDSGETVNLMLSNPTGGATLGTPATATLTINTPSLLLILDPAGPVAQHAAALDSLFLMRDPFPVIQVSDLLNRGPDRNTRVILFIANLQQAPGDVASIVKVTLFDSIGQSHNVDAEDVRLASVPDFMQVIFRLPDNLRAGVVVIKVKSRDQESNVGTIRIR